VVAELGLVLVALFAGTPVPGSTRRRHGCRHGRGLGAQNSAVRRLAVPDVTTTVPTMTLTGTAADLRSQGPTVVAHRLLAVAMMLIGAVGGALLDLRVGRPAAVGAVAAVLVVVLAGTRLARPKAGWRAWPGR
jgi:uncharacterized membrane protein YoaK (UPF0700 family)